MAEPVNVVVNKAGDQYSLKVQQGNKQAEIPLEGCKSQEEAEIVKQALLTEINKAEVAKGTKEAGVGNKMDKAA